MKTRYRTVNNGYWELLQYEVVETYTVGFWFLKKTLERKYWAYVPRPFYDEFYGRFDPVRSDTTVNSLKNNLDQFVKDYPDITEYWKVYEKQQAVLVEQAKAKNEAYRQRKKNVKYYD